MLNNGLRETGGLVNLNYLCRATDLQLSLPLTLKVHFILLHFHSRHRGINVLSKEHVFTGSIVDC